MTTKSKKQGYYSATPKKWRKLGDALLAVSTMITTYAIADDWSKWVQMSALLLGVIGKFLSNMFTEDPQDAHSSEQPTDPKND